MFRHFHEMFEGWRLVRLRPAPFDKNAAREATTVQIQAKLVRMCGPKHIRKASKESKASKVSKARTMSTAVTADE